MPDQRLTWQRLGRALLPTRTIGAADLELVRVAALALTAADRAVSVGAKPTAINAALRLAGDLLSKLGIGPTSRADPIPEPQKLTEQEKRIAEFIRAKGT